MQFLKTSLQEGLFNRTVIFVLGDHGNRMDFIRRTKVGTIEDRMPMVTVILPDWVSTKYPSWKESLRDNRMRLTSTYDIYATFRHILSTLNNQNKSTDIKQHLLNSIQDKKVKNHFSATSAGLSFFEPVPLVRDCNAAGVAQWLCVCNEGRQKQLDPEHPYSLAASNEVIRLDLHIKILIGTYCLLANYNLYLKNYHQNNYHEKKLQYKICFCEVFTYVLFYFMDYYVNVYKHLNKNIFFNLNFHKHL